MSNIDSIFAAQRAFFGAGATRPVAFRLRQLERLGEALRAGEGPLTAALREDLGKSASEAFQTEFGQARVELNHALRNARAWARPRRLPPSLAQLPGAAFIQPEPRGVSLILAPWNYPVLMTLAPLIPALAAGNTAIVKPSELAPATSAALAQLVADHFDPGLVAVVEGDATAARALLEQPVDFIFFTGGTSTGRAIAEAAARQLTPCVLELGGKSPALVAADADVDRAARRIAWGKYLNAGQTCIAPDYVLVDRRVMPAFLDGLKRHITAFYGEDPRRSPDYGRIVNRRHFDRLSACLGDGRVVHGGQTNADDRYIAPTVLDDVNVDGPLMRDEIFGPLLPVIPAGSMDEAIAFVNARPKPLALYVFSRDRKTQEDVLRRAPSGGACVNDVMFQIASPYMPFGGVGASGYGAYHGRHGFDAFSHLRSVVMKPSGGLDFWFRYAPIQRSYDRILRWILR